MIEITTVLVAKEKIPRSEMSKNMQSKNTEHIEELFKNEKEVLEQGLRKDLGMNEVQIRSIHVTEVVDKGEL